jgi:hypothetical protein
LPCSTSKDAAAGFADDDQAIDEKIDVMGLI